MRKFKCLCYVLIAVFLLSFSVYADEQSYTSPGGRELILNGSGFRSKFFIKVYEGFLYLPKSIAKEDNPVSDEKIIYKKGYPGVIEMKFVYDKVGAEKIRKAFGEGIEKNMPSLKDKEYVSKFLHLFDFDLTEGDVLTLYLINKDTVSVIYNNKKVDSISGENLGKGVYNIYLGNEPADDNLKDRMLGK